MSRTYTNYLAKFGIDDAKAKARVEEIFNTIFYGSDDEKFFHKTDDGMGYMEDTGNHDARTEGMSYGMMMCVQLDKKDEFDRLWKWSKKYMYMDEGWSKDYFAWSCGTDGTKYSMGAAPDGEEFFAMSLILAGNRWGNGEGILNYHEEARKLLHNMIRKGSNGLPGFPMFNNDNHYIKFIDSVEFSDPSYHLPHFYELYAEYAMDEDKEFFREAAKASREYWKKCCHKDTGLSAEYAEYDGTPHVGDHEKYNGRHDWFYSDAYRTILNIAVDAVWFGLTDWAKEEGSKYLDFFNAKLEEGTWDNIYEIDGRMLDQKVLHPVAIIATTATAYILSPEKGEKWLKKFLETPLRTGDRRYYDNCLYFFSYMILSGNYQIR